MNHFLQFSVFGGTLTSVQGAMGTGPYLVPGFPFTLIRQMRVLRNGSDVVAALSGEMLAKHHFYLNKAHPMARLYTTTSNVETLLTSSVRGLTIPANSEGIGSNQASFKMADAASSSAVLSFDMQLELWFQMSSDDAYYATLVDSRKLATFQVEITWATEAQQIATAGTANTSYAASFNMGILSLDQDNLDVKNDFGTFKRSMNTYANLAYSSSNNQILLPRGNFYHGIIVETKAFKAGSSTNMIAENSVIDSIENRINTSFSLKKFGFRQLQAKNIADSGGRPQAWDLAQGAPQGYAYISYHNAAQKAAELVPTYVMDQFDLQLGLNALGSATNGVTTNASLPSIALLIEEVVPGVSIGSGAPQAPGSMGSAKPFAR